MTAAQGLYGGRKVREGTVVSDKMQKTVLVAVEAHFRHRLYKKSVRRVRRFMAHDEMESAQMGDRVRIVEASPISRMKRWRVVEVLTRAELPEVAAGEIDLELLGEVKHEEEPARETPAPVVEDAVSEPKVEAATAEGAAEAVAPEEVVIEEEPELEIEIAEEEPEAEGAADDITKASKAAEDSETEGEQA